MVLQEQKSTLFGINVASVLFLPFSIMVLVLKRLLLKSKVERKKTISQTFNHVGEYKMNNQNIIISENQDTTKRCIEMLKELIAMQEKALRFLATEGIDDSKEGLIFANSFGEALKAFDGILPEGVYDKIISEEVA